MFIPLAILYFRAGRPVRQDDFKVAVPIALLGVIVAVVCCYAAPRVPGLGALLLGTASGIIFPIFGGFILARAMGGFELSATTFSGFLAIAVPSGLAGGIIGWRNRKHRNSHSGVHL